MARKYWPAGLMERSDALNLEKGSFIAAERTEDCRIAETLG
jgi:hypothetical protein